MRRPTQAQDIHATLTQSLAGPNTVAELTTKLGAIDTGIQQIQSNPLLALVQGDALTELRTMRDEVSEQLQYARGRREAQTSGETT